MDRQSVMDFSNIDILFLAGKYCLRHIARVGGMNCYHWSKLEWAHALTIMNLYYCNQLADKIDKLVINWPTSGWEWTCCGTWALPMVALCDGVQVWVWKCSGDVWFSGLGVLRLWVAAAIIGSLMVLSGLWQVWWLVVPAMEGLAAGSLRHVSWQFEGRERQRGGPLSSSPNSK